MAEGASSSKPAGRGDFLHLAAAGAAPERERTLAEVAVELGYCTAAQLAQLRVETFEQGRTSDDLVALLLEKKILTQEQLRACKRALSGRSVIGGFEILEKVGQGGMGTVFRARQISMDRIVAVKILAPKLAQDPQFRERFLKEARVSAKLSHLNIINGIDCGEDCGYTFFAMEFVDGRTLKAVLKERGRLVPAEALAVVRQVGDALVYARHQGLVHRDIKPDNIMLTTTGLAKLCDLGLAKHGQELEVENGAEKGMAVGTPHYMSPEQARGEENVDARSDIYSLGATFYHLLTGSTLFQGTTSAAVMSLHLTHEAKSPCAMNPAVPEGYGQIVAKMLAKDAKDRYQTAEEMVEDLDLVKAGQAPKAATFQSCSSCEMIAARSGLGGGAFARFTGFQKKTPRRVLSPIVAVCLLAAAVYGAYKLYELNKPVVIPEAVKPHTHRALVPPQGGSDNAETAAAQPPADAATTPSVKTAGAAALPAQPAETKAPPAPAETKAPPVPPVETPPVAKAPPPKPKTVKTPPPTPPQLEMPRPKLVLGPDVFYARFLAEVTARAGKIEVAKLAAEMRDVARKSEFQPARQDVNQELEDLQAAAAFETSVLKALSDAQGEIDLSDEMERKWNAKSGKIVGFEDGRGLSVSIGGATFYMTGLALPAEMLASHSTDALAKIRYLSARGRNEAAFALLPSLPPPEAKRWERKLTLEIIGEKELTARETFKNLATVAEAQRWKTFSEMDAEFAREYGGTPTAHEHSEQLTHWRETAAAALSPAATMSGLCHAASVRKLSDGLMEMVFDFKTPQQALDFACDDGELRVKDGRLWAPHGGNENTLVRFRPPIEHLRLLRVQGRVLQAQAGPVGVLFFGPGMSPSPASPGLKVLPAAHGATLDDLASVQTTHKPVTFTPTEDIEIMALASPGSNELTWSANGVIAGTGILPPVVVNGGLVLWAQGTNASWRSFKIIFKPGEAWQAEAAQNDAADAPKKAE